MESTSRLSSPADGTGAAIRWIIADGFADAIHGDDAPDWNNPADDPRAETIKENPRRRIIRLQTRTATLFVKEFRSTSLRAKLRRRLRGSEALREWRNGRRAEDSGIPCVRHVAVGVGATREYLVMLEAANARSLADVWRETAATEGGPSQRRRRRELIDGTAALLAAAHDRGFVHGDDHPRNIFVRPFASGGAEALYVDLYTGRFRGSLSRSAVVSSLAQLNQWFRRRSSRLDRTRFLRAYCRRRCAGDERAARRLLGELAPAVATESDRQALRLWRKRDRRILGSNAYFARIDLGDGSVAHVALRCRHRDLLPVAAAPDRSAAQWRKLLEDEAADGAASEMFGSVARERFVTAHRLRNRDLPCRCPSAIVETRSRTGERTSRLWWDEGAPAENLFRRWTSTRRPHDRTRLCAAVAALVRLLSLRGGSLREVGEETFAISDDGPLVYIDDTRGVRLRRHDPPRDLMETTRAVVAFGASTDSAGRTDAVRLLRAVSPRGWKSVWRRIPDLNRSADDGR